MAESRVEQWSALGRDVSNLLNEYVAIHDSLIRQSGFRGLFRAIDFDELATRGRAVLLALNQRQTEVDALFKDTAVFLGPSEAELANCLSQYTHSLRTAVGLFLEVMAGLIAKKEGRSLTMSQHRDNWQRYEKAIASYTALGAKLNTLYKGRTSTPS